MMVAIDDGGSAGALIPSLAKRSRRNNQEILHASPVSWLNPSQQNSMSYGNPNNTAYP
jgi:hypothetical protein